MHNCLYLNLYVKVLATREFSRRLKVAMIGKLNRRNIMVFITVNKVTTKFKKKRYRAERFPSGFPTKPW